MISLDGNTSAYMREPCTLRHDSVPIIVESEYNPLHTHVWIPWEHYVPVKKDMSDLIEKIKWCQENDDKAKEIAYAGRALFNKLYSFQALQEDAASVFSKYAELMTYTPDIDDETYLFDELDWREGVSLEEHMREMDEL